MIDRYLSAKNRAIAEIKRLISLIMDEQFDKHREQQSNKLFEVIKCKNRGSFREMRRYESNEQHRACRSLQKYTEKEVTIDREFVHKNSLLYLVLQSPSLSEIIQEAILDLNRKTKLANLKNSQLNEILKYSEDQMEIKKVKQFLETRN